MFKLFCLKFPIFKRIGKILYQNKNFAIQIHKEKIEVLENFLGSDDITKKILNLFSLENSTRFGCVSKVEIENKIYSLHYLELARQLSVIAERINFHEIQSMFEIGGGFGVNVHIMLQNYKNIKKVVYLDIVPNLVVGTEYLRSLYGDSVKDYVALKNQGNINFSNDDDLEIICIPPWLIEKLNCKVDYFHNAHSFVEMPEDVLINYVKFVEKILVHDGKIGLISYGSFSTDTTLNSDKLTSYFSRDFFKSHHSYLSNPKTNFYCYISDGAMMTSHR